MDSLGRIVIPKQIRDKLGLEPGNVFHIAIDDDWVCIKKYITAESCVFRIKDLLSDLHNGVTHMPNQELIAHKLRELASLLDKEG